MAKFSIIALCHFSQIWVANQTATSSVTSDGKVGMMTTLKFNWTSAIYAWMQFKIFTLSGKNTYSKLKLMVKCTTAVFLLLMHWRYGSFAHNHRNIAVSFKWYMWSLYQCLIYQWLSARLQYLLCVYHADTVVLHQAINMILYLPSPSTKTQAISSTPVSDLHLSPPGALQVEEGIFATNIVKKSIHAIINKIRPLIFSYVFVSINYMNASWYWWGVYDFFQTIKDIWSQNFSI